VQLAEHGSVAPAKCRVGKTEKLAGASMEKKMIPPIQTMSESSIKKRTNAMPRASWVAGSEEMLRRE
jgi:hypothetical protein